MRNHILIIILCCFLIPTVSNGQMEKSSWMARGNLGFNFSKQDFNLVYPDNTGFYKSNVEIPKLMFSPGIGFFVLDNLVIGIEGSYLRQRINSSIDSDYITGEPTQRNSTDYGLGIFVRKLFPIDTQFSFFTELQVGRSWHESEYIILSDGTRPGYGKSKNSTIQAGLGIQYLISKRISLEVKSGILGYHNLKIEEIVQNPNLLMPNSDSRNFSFNAGEGFNIAMNFFF